MSVFISDVGTAELYVQSFRPKQPQPLAQCAISLKRSTLEFLTIDKTLLFML